MLLLNRKYTITDIRNKKITFYRGGPMGFGPNILLHHFSDHLSVASEHKPVHSCYIWLKNPLIVDFKNNRYENVPINDVEFFPESFKKVFEEYHYSKFEAFSARACTLYISICARENGFDGVIFLNVKESMYNYPSCDVTVFRSENIYGVKLLKEPEVNELIKKEEPGKKVPLNYKKYTQ